MAYRTDILDVHERNPEPRHIRKAGDVLEKGGIVLIPTQTGYCFVGDPTKGSTQKKFLELREAHPRKKPFSLLCSDIAQASGYSIINTTIYRVATRVFPGPFTFILDVSRSTPKFAGISKRRTVGIRIDSHSVAQAVIRYFNGPLLVTSVTDSKELMENDYFEGDSSADSWWTEAWSIVEHFGNGSFDLALQNDGPVPMAVSSVVDFTCHPPELVRDGGWDTGDLGIF